MGYIHCCGGLRKTKSFVLAPSENFIMCEIDYLGKCPICGHTVVQLTRIDEKNEITSIRYTNKQARKFFEKLKPKILYERKYYDYSKIYKGTFYLYYNEFGIKKRCYSNISNLKIGLKTNL
ncbi:hypothetical protein J6G99_05620 [bacterium]|nr:hypothetical protein [bacterium]